MVFLFEEFVEEKRIWYNKIGQCYCPVLKKNIFFNSKGFYHLIYNGSNKVRTIKERIYRLSLLPLVIPVIRSAKIVTEHREQTCSRFIGKKVEYWMLQEIVGRQNAEVSVILRKIGNGQTTFYSVWKKRSKK